MMDVVPDSADELTPGYSLPRMLLARVGDGTLISPEIGPVPLFSPASDASTHFSPAPARPPAATDASQSLFGTYDASRAAIERCISLVSQSPVSVSRGAAAAETSSTRSGCVGPEAGGSPGPGSSPAAPSPAHTVHWPAASYGLDSDGTESDGDGLVWPGPSATNSFAATAEHHSADQPGPSRVRGSIRSHRELGPEAGPATGDYRRLRERTDRRTQRSQRSTDARCRPRQRERPQASMPACREDGASEVRRQLTLLSRLRQLLGKVKNQLDDDGENISRSRLRELKNRLHPCASALDSMVNGCATKEVSQRLAKVQEVSNSLLLRMNMLEDAGCRSSTSQEAPTTTRRPEAGGRTSKRKGQSKKETKPVARDRRRSAPSPEPSPPGSPVARSPSPPSPPDMPSPAAPSPVASSPDVTETPDKRRPRVTFEALNVPVATAPSAVPTAATPAAPVGTGSGAFPAPPAGSAAPWFWQWPMGMPAGYAAWPPPPPAWFGQTPWDRQPLMQPMPPPAAASSTAMPPPPPVFTAPAEAPQSPATVAVSAAAQGRQSQPSVKVADSVPVERSQSSTEQLEGGSTEKAASSDSRDNIEEIEVSAVPGCDESHEEPVSAEDKVDARRRCRSLVMLLRTARLVEDNELMPLGRDCCWDRPETLLEAGDDWWRSG